MSEVKISTSEVLNGGIIELFKVEGLYYVKSVIDCVVKFSGAVKKVDAEYLVFDAKYYGNLDF